MSFNDIFKSSYLENVTAVSLPDMALALVLSFCLGLFIYFVYKKTYSGVMFSRTFGGSLVAMTMITTMVILAVTSNVVLSLGMVGALSIVRFRAAIKEPMDMLFNRSLSSRSFSFSSRSALFSSVMLSIFPSSSPRICAISRRSSARMSDISRPCRFRSSFAVFSHLSARPSASSHW